MLKEGDILKDFGRLNVIDSKSEWEISIKDLIGKRTVIYFYPRDQTPGCIKEACSFRDSNTKLLASGIQVFGVSSDNIHSHKEFITKYSLNFPLISDDKKVLSLQVGSWGEKNLYGKVLVGMMRSTFVIGPDLKIMKVWPKVKSEGHADQVLEYLTSL